MNESAIKQEFDINSQCRTCLSVGRKLLPLAGYLNVFKILTSHINSWDKILSGTMEVCWECHSLLRRAAKFQSHVCKANELLELGQTYLYGTLSSLMSTSLHGNSHTIFLQESTQTITKTNETQCLKTDESSDNDPTETQNELNELETKPDINKELKKTNRWAKQRAIQNQKPKFKMLRECDEVFRKIKLGIEEFNLFVEGLRASDYYKSKKYKCQSCVMAFKDNRMLLKHVQKCHKEIHQYICDLCNSTFLNKRHLSAHIRKHYYVFECTLCSHRCNNKNQRRHHFQKEHRKVFQCLKCELKFCSRREFFKHFKEWHENFICDHCGISFKMRYCIKDHIKKQHSSFECKPCNKTFARYNGLWLHNKLRHTPPGQTAYCVECDKRYVDVYRYRWHLANSARHKPRKRLRIPCPGCDKIFSKNIYMKDHYNLVHLKYYKYRCEECDKNFIRNADLVKHRRRVHEGILPPKNKICDMCGRGFTTNKILTNHMRTHTGERPFVCTVCPARFAQHAALASHIRAVHDKLNH